MLAPNKFYRPRRPEQPYDRSPNPLLLLALGALILPTAAEQTDTITDTGKISVEVMFGSFSSVADAYTKLDRY